MCGLAGLIFLPRVFDNAIPDSKLEGLPDSKLAPLLPGGPGEAPPVPPMPLVPSVSAAPLPTAGSLVIGYSLAIMAGLLSALQFGLVTFAKRRVRALFA